MSPRTKSDIELRDRLLAPIAVSKNDEVVGADLGGLVRRLILFEDVFLETHAMRELPYLINALGPDDFVKLVSSDALRIQGHAWTVGEIGNSGIPIEGFGRTPLPPLTFKLERAERRRAPHSLVPGRDSQHEPWPQNLSKDPPHDR